jgi:outer membrane protein TolC
MKNTNKILLTLLLPVLIFAQQKLTLEQCREMAVRNNYQIKIAAENVSAATHNVKSSRTAFLPKISFAGMYQRVNSKIKYEIEEMSLPVSNRDGSFDVEHLEAVIGPDGNPMTNPDGSPMMAPKNWLHIPATELKLGEYNNYLLNIGLTQPIFTGGKIIQQYKISKSTEKIAEAQKALTNDEVILKADELFWKTISLEEKVKLARDFVSMVETHIQDLKQYLYEGLITSNDLLKAKVKLNEGKMNLLKAENGFALAKMALCQHVGLPLHTDVQLYTSNDMEFTLVNTSTAGDEFLAKREELKILEETISINKSAEKVAVSQYLPNIILTSNYTTLNPNPYNSFKDEFGSDINVGITAQIDIFGWNDRGHKVASARHLRKAAEQKYEESKDLMKLEIQQAAFHVSESVKKITLAKTALQQAEENRAVTKDNFKEGLVKSADVLEAQTLWQKAKAQLIDSQSEYQINLTRYYKTTGQL